MLYLKHFLYYLESAHSKLFSSLHALECVHEEQKAFLRVLQGILALNQLPLAVQKFVFHRDLGTTPQALGLGLHHVCHRIQGEIPKKTLHLK